MSPNSLTQLTSTAVADLGALRATSAKVRLVPTPDYVAIIRRVYGQGRLLLPGVSTVVVRSDLEPGRIHLLLTRRSDTGRWSLPAGILEPSEQPAAAALRELLEETRIMAQVERLALLTTDPDVVYPNGDTCQFVSMCFRCRYVSGEAQVGDEESTEVAWFPADELPEELGATTGAVSAAPWKIATTASSTFRPRARRGSQKAVS